MASSYPSQDEVLSGEPVLEWIDRHILRSDPFAFEGVEYRDVVELVAREFQIDINGIFCIGSGAVGLSLNPKKIQNGALKPFGDSSDLDLAFISEAHFEQAWRDLRRESQPTLDQIHPDLLASLNWQRKRLFDGAIIAHKMLPFISFGPVWMTALAKLEAAVSGMMGRNIDVNMWLYRDYWSVRNYVSESLMKCRKELA